MSMKCFTVTGSGPFPFDMLRYDQCWPYESEDAAKMSGDEIRSIVLQTDWKRVITYKRWSSFTWEAVPGVDR